MNELAATSAIAEFAASVSAHDVPAAVRARAIETLADTIGVAIAGAGSEPARVLLRALQRGRAIRSAGARLWGTPHTASTTDASLFNGLAAHALEFDDTVHPGPLHPSASVVPACVAAAELAGSSGAELVTAYAAAIEVSARLSKAMNPEHYANGWHGTGPIGAVSSAAGAARLLGLDASGISAALGIAASLASGLRRNTGSMTKPMHAGNAARSGILAALSAEAGLTSVAGALDGELGFIVTMRGSRDKYERLVTRSKSTWELDDVDAWGLKAYPLCGEATSVVDALTALGRRIELAMVDRVVVRTGPRAKRILRYPDPVDLEQARFSLPFVVALVLATGRPSLSSMSDERLTDPQIRRRMARVEHIEEPDAPLGDYGARVEVITKTGKRAVEEVVVPSGWASARLTEDERRTKFVECAGDALGTDAAAKLFGTLCRLDQVGSVTDLTV